MGEVIPALLVGAFILFIIWDFGVKNSLAFSGKWIVIVIFFLILGSCLVGKSSSRYREESYDYSQYKYDIKNDDVRVEIVGYS